MRADILDQRPRREWALLVLAGLVSVTAHLALASGAAGIEPRRRAEPVWMEMAISAPERPPEAVPEPEPEPVPEPEPEPEPERPPEVLDYVPPPPTPTPTPPEAKPVPRAVQGLSNDSFLPGSGSATTARAGNTTTVRATEERMALADAGQPIPYASVTEAPKVKYKPALVVPDEVIAAKVEGTVELLLTIDVEGKVTAIEVVSKLHPAADAACVAAMRSSRWKPGGRGGAPAIVRGVPYACRFQESGP